RPLLLDVPDPLGRAVVVRPGAEHDPRGDADPLLLRLPGHRRRVRGGHRHRPGGARLSDRGRDHHADHLRRPVQRRPATPPGGMSMRIRRTPSRPAAQPGPAVRRLAALALVGLIAAVVAGALIADNSRGGGMCVYVESGRAGLVLAPGAMVKMHGVQIGTVAAVHTDSVSEASGSAGDAGTTVEVSVDRSAGPIPADVHAAIRWT